MVATAGTLVARLLGGGSGADALRPTARMPRERRTGAVAARGRRESQVVSVISRAPRPDAGVLPVSPDDDAAVKVA